MVHGEKKSRTTNLDFPSVLLNQGLTEANNNTREETSFAFFHKQGGKKKGKKREEKRGKETVNIAESSTRRRLFARQHIPPQNNFCENAHYTQQEKQREYIKTRSQTTRSSPHRKRTNTDLSKHKAQREKEEKHFIERERSLKSAQSDLDVPIDRIEEV